MGWKYSLMEWEHKHKSKRFVLEEMNQVQNKYAGGNKIAVQKIFVQAVFVVILAVSISSCAHRVVRTGYDEIKTTLVDCQVPIAKELPADTVAQEIGQVKLGDSGFSTACNEAHALAILQKEACSIGADLVVITQENRPDLKSSCYRCEATFFRMKKEEYKPLLKNDFQQEEVNARVTEDRSKNVAMGIIAGVLGFIIGYSLFSR